MESRFEHVPNPDATQSRLPRPSQVPVGSAVGTGRRRVPRDLHRNHPGRVAPAALGRARHLGVLGRPARILIRHRIAAGCDPTRCSHETHEPQKRVTNSGPHLLVFNTVTALAPWYPLILAARFIAGAAAALVWGVLAGYARGLVPTEQQGRALTVTGIGQPIALAAGVPLGALAGTLVDWRWVFVAISLAAAGLAAWIATAVPDVPSQAPSVHLPLRRVILMPGIRPVLIIALVWVLAHNILYTYIAPLLEPTGLRLELGLALFGVASFLGITAAGAIIDRALRATVLSVLTLMAVASLALANPMLGTWVVSFAIALWGFSFGGAPALLQTALADRAGEHTDAAQSVFVTVFNLAVASGGIIGGAMLSAASSTSVLAWVAVVLVLAAFMMAILSRKAFSPGRRST